MAASGKYEGQLKSLIILLVVVVLPTLAVIGNRHMIYVDANAKHCWNMVKYVIKHKPELRFKSVKTWPAEEPERQSWGRRRIHDEVWIEFTASNSFGVRTEGLATCSYDPDATGKKKAVDFDVNGHEYTGNDLKDINLLSQPI